MKLLKDLNVSGKRVFVRVDFNVPIRKGRVLDDTRIRAALPTIKYLLEKKATVILASHLGRPQGKDSSFSLYPVAYMLDRLLKQKVVFVDNYDSWPKEKASVFLLENLRFYPEEEANDSKFAKKLASFADCYVDDAFGACHRAHASIVGVPELLPHAAGLLLEKEVNMLSLDNPKRPFVGILGGAKVSDKIKIIESLLKKVDILLVGGAMANTFWAVHGEVGRSLYEKENLAVAEKLLKTRKIVLPDDFVLDNGKISKSIPKERSAMDIGPNTVKIFACVLERAKTVFWNGPMGMFEEKKFAKGTFDVAKCISKLHAVTIVGGGDSVAAINEIGLSDKFTHISTGGGAALEFIENPNLPGLVALK